ncbi:LysM peptidoglycan-binding domain-containing protein [Candidatus Saccharibacteria bacterium]|nr:LysM peptidoglycan-binding domain-containing protein [Candidatus Saccharibacteria bacterium]
MNGLPLLSGRRLKKVKKAKLSSAALYLSAFLLIAVIASIGYYKSSDDNTLANASKNNQTVSQTDSPLASVSVDDVVATDVAAIVAKSANLSIANNVSDLAISTEIQNQIALANAVNMTKPQIIDSATENHSVIRYTVADGDTLDSIAAKFSVSVQTIKWANNLVGSGLTVGNSLKILPVDGVLYTVKSGDTIDSIADKYKVDRTRLVVYNDLDVSGLNTNTSIILPSGVLPENERPGYVAPVVINYYSIASSGFGGKTWYISTGTPAGPYAYGNCTLYAYNRRNQLGLPVSSNWGNASSWAYMAAQQGLTVNNTPTIGAIMQNGGGYGHVAIVEAIESNGDISISEMNAYVPGGGWNIVSGRIVPAANVGQYLYIH